MNGVGNTSYTEDALNMFRSDKKFQMLQGGLTSVDPGSIPSLAFNLAPLAS